MYLTLIFSFLLTISTVSGDFEEIRFRQYEPALEIEALINKLWKEGVVNQDFDRVRINRIDKNLIYTDGDKKEHGGRYFFEDILYKLDKTIHPEIYDIQHRNHVNKPDEKLISIFEPRDVIFATVQWGGSNFLLEFWKLEHLNITWLSRANYSTEKPTIQLENHNNFAAYLVEKMIELEEDVLAPGFVYQTCDNRTIKNRTELVEEKFNNIMIEVPNSIHFRNTNSSHKYIQSEVDGSDGNIHLFEFDSETKQILRAMEYCEKLQNPEKSPKIEPFDKILHRRFEPAIQVQSLLNRIMLSARDRGIFNDISDIFEFVNLNNEVTGSHDFLEELKKSSIYSSKVMDVQEVALNQEFGLAFEGKREEGRVTLSYLYATVKLGDNYMLLKLKYWPKRDELLLIFARHYQESIRFQFAYEYDNVMGYIIGLGNREDVVDSEFIYRNCQNQTITDAYDLTVFPEDSFGITDLVTFKNENQDYIQFEIIVNDRTHYFEINDSTRKFTVGMEYPC